MPIQNVGDMSQHFQSLRQVGQAKSSLNRLSNELATQQKSDVTASLRGATTQLETLEREINRLGGYIRANQEVGQRLSFMQSALSGLDDLRTGTMTEFLSITEQSRDASIQSAARTGEQAFSRITAAFNSRLGDLSLFSGTATDRVPLASAETMLSDIKTATAGLDSADDIISAVDAWFEDPVGGFATIGYLGDTGALIEQKTDANNSITIEARADGDATKNLLKAAALAALADQSIVGLSKETRGNLVATSGQMMLGAGDDLTDMRGSLGANEATISEAYITLSAQLTAFEINRNELTVADPFETATRLQDVQQQLEMQYTVTARLSQLSLVNFLR